MSFGSSGFGGFGSNTNQQSSPFGGSGFGSNNANAANNNTASTGFGGFGGSNTANTGGSLFGGGNNTNTNTAGGFGNSTGGFGANNQTSSFGQNRAGGFGASSTPSGGLFGNSANNSTNTGFGGFGASSAQNTSSPFGGGASNTTGGSLFGQNNQASSTGFGGTTNTSSPFGASNTNAGFGSTGGGFGASTTTPAFGSSANTQQNNGTGGAPFQAFVDKDGVGGQQQQYMSITCQEPYRNFSFEELRVQDYLQGRKYGNSNGQGGAFGTSTGFGGFGGNNTTTNTSSPFGANNNNNNNNNSNPFGQQSSAPGFGANTASATGGFGGSGGLFGQSKPATGSLFGNTSTANNQQSTSLFGNNNNASNTTNNAFGGNTSGGGLFGTPKPTTGFGTSTTNAFGANNNQSSTGGLFGNSNNNNTNTGASTLFGNNNQQQQQQQQAGNSFGGSLFGSNTGGTTQQANQGSGGSLFGNSAFGANNQQSKPGGLFGGNTNTGTGGGLFGGSNTSGQQQQTGTGTGGLFGNSVNNNNQQGQNTGGLFGAPKPTTTAGLFGGTQTNTNTGGTGLFGGTQNNTGGGLFGGSQPANNTGSSLFGTTNNQQKPGGLFGGGGAFGQTNNNAAGGNSLFGAQSQNNNNSNQSLFGGSLLSSQQQQQQQQQQQAAQGLTASISSNTPYGNNELFASLATPQQSVGPLATPLSSSQKQRKPAPLAQWKINPAASSRLITPQKRTGGYGFSYSTYGTPGSAYGSPSLYGGLLSGGNSSRLNKSLSTSNLRTTYSGGAGGETVLNPDAFSPSPRSYRAGGSLKKLHINRNLRSDLFGNEDAAQKSSPLKKAVSFDPNQSQGSNGDASSTALARIDDSDSATPSAEELGFIRSPSKTPNGSADTNGASDVAVEQVQGNELAVVPEDEPEGENRSSAQQQQRPLSMFPDQSDKTPGEYWMKPTKAEVAKMSRQQRKSVKGFTVGREHTGSIEFSEVNLDGVDLDRVVGKDIRITVREATVYPDDLNKPPPGKGFNVPSTITLFNAWPRARAGQIPVYERRGKRYEKHIERLQKVNDTEFVDYDPSNGSWTFRVKHFSSYQVPDYYDDDEPLEFTSSMFSVPADTPSRQVTSSGQSLQMSSNFVLGNGSLQMDDPFASQSNRLPGAFDDDVLFDPRILSNGFKESKPADEGVVKSAPAPMQPVSDSMQPSQTPEQSFQDNSISGMDGTMEMDGPRHSAVLEASVKPKSILKASQQLPYFGGTPTRAADPATGDWADQLQRTISPKKQTRTAFDISTRQGNSLNGSITKETAPFATSLDVFKSLFGGSEKEKSSRQMAEGKGFQWPYPKRSQLGPDAKQEQEDEWQAIFKPSWAAGELALAEPSVASDMMEAQRSLTTFTVENGVPQAEMKSAFSFAVLADAAESQASKATSPAQIKLLQEESTMWQLAHLLFDDVEDGDQEDESRVRKEKVKNFWAQLVEASARAQADEAATPEAKAIAYLSCRQVEAAAHILSEGRDFRLAMSVAQIGAVEEMREGMAQQVEHWRDNNSLSEMSVCVRILYELLTGNTTVSEGKTGAGPENRAADIFIAQECNLDWRRSFGLRLWYGSPSAEKLTAAILNHHVDLEQGEEKVEPAPWFAAGKSYSQDGQDILWGLLKVFVMFNTQGVDRTFYDAVWDDYGKMIAAANVVGDATSTRLTFQLYQALAARGIIDHDAEGRSTNADQHAIDLGYELASSASNLADGVFVTLHIQDAALRERAVKALLDRHAGAIGDDGETSALYQTLTNDFGIPEAWLWAAKASYARKVLGDDALEMRCLLRAGERRAAHEALRRRVGPRAVVEEQLDVLRRILQDFEAAGVDKGADWAAGGGLYADYAALAALPRASTSKRGERRRLALRLTQTLPAVDAVGLALEERAAVADIAEAAGRVLKEVDGADGSSATTVPGDAEDGDAATASISNKSMTPRFDRQQDAVLRETLRLADRWAARVLVA